MAGAKLLLLQHELERRAGEELRQLPFHEIGLVTHHRDHRRTVQRERGPDGEVRQGTPADLVQHLGPVALHPGPFAGGEDYGCDGVHRRSFQSTLRPPARAAARHLLVGLAPGTVNRRTPGPSLQASEMARAKRVPC